MGLTRDEIAATIAGVFLAALVALTTCGLGGCGGPSAAAVSVTRSYQRAVMESDQATEQTALRYSEHARAHAKTHLPSGQQLEYYEETMAPFWAATEALERAKEWALLLDDALESWAALGAEHWLRAASCAWAAGMRAAEQIAALPFDVPTRLPEQLRLLADFGLGECSE